MLNELAIQRGNIAILGESNPLSIRQHSGNAPFHSEQTLLAGETLLTLARQQVFTWGSSRSTAWRVSLSKLFDFT